MKLFDLLKSKKNVEILSKPDNDLTHLTPDGELPWGWHNQNKDFVEKTNNEYSFFLNNWLNSRNTEPKKRYEALKSFVAYLEDAEALCKRKGECFEFWFYAEVASKDYILKRKNELNELVKNFAEVQKQYEERKIELLSIDLKIKQALKENQGILQSDFVKTFNPVVQNDVKDKLYHLEKSGKLQRTKSGRSYILNYKG